MREVGHVLTYGTYSPDLPAHIKAGMLAAVSTMDNAEERTAVSDQVLTACKIARDELKQSD